MNTLCGVWHVNSAIARAIIGVHVNEGGTGKGVMLFGALLLLFSTVAMSLTDFLWRRGLIDPIVVVVVHLG